MTATLLAFPVFRAFDSNGAPLAGGLLYSYQAGTTTPLATYVDQAGVTQNTNPVVLDSTGTANVWLGDSTYKLVLKDKDGVQQWSVDNIQSEGVLINGVYTNLANTSDVGKGDALIGVKSVLTGGVARTQHEKNADWVSVKDFGAKGDSSTDDSSSIQAAINAVYANGGGTIWFPTGGYNCSSQIELKNKVHLQGDGTEATRLIYSGTDDFIVIKNPINSSTVADISIKDMYLAESVDLNMQDWRGLIYDTGSTYFTIERVRLSTHRIGIILDQTELCNITDIRYYGSGGTTDHYAGVWLVNGNDKRDKNGLSGVSSPGYTNRISIEKSQFVMDSGAVGIADDGGFAHAFRDNNFDGGKYHIRVQDASPLVVDGGEYEQPHAASIFFSGGTFALGTAPSSTVVGKINGMFSSVNGTASNIDFNGSSACVEISNNLFNTDIGLWPMANIPNGASVIASGNRQDGSSTKPYNNVFDKASLALTWSSSGTAPSLGGGGYCTSNYSRNGKIVTVNIELEVGSSATFGSGTYSINVPITADSSAIRSQGDVVMKISSREWNGSAILDPSTSLLRFLFADNSTYGNAAYNFPTTWVDYTTLNASITYEAANSLY